MTAFTLRFVAQHTRTPTTFDISRKRVRCRLCYDVSLEVLRFGGDLSRVAANRAARRSIAREERKREKASGAGAWKRCFAVVRRALVDPRVVACGALASAGLLLRSSRRRR